MSADSVHSKLNRLYANKTRKSLVRWEMAARVVRGFAVGWDGLALLTFVTLCFEPAYEPSVPLFIGGSGLLLVCLIVLCLPFAAHVRQELPRVLMVLRWQVVSGVTLAFTIAWIVKDEIHSGFLLLGIYLLLAVLPFMAMSLIGHRLSVLYAERDALEASNRQRPLFRRIAGRHHDRSASRTPPPHG